MNDLETTFRDGLRQAVAERRGDIRVDIDDVIARASSPDFVPGTRWTPPRWLAAAAAVLVVSGLGVGMAVLRPSAGLPAVPSAPSAPATPSTWFDASSLIGSQWWAMQIDGRSVQMLGAATSPSLTFTSASEVLTNDGCNTTYRSYRLTPHGVLLDATFGLVGAQTEIGCNPTQQQRFATALDETTQARLSSDLLELLDPNGNVVLRFARADDSSPQPTLPPTDGVVVAISPPSAPVTTSQTPTPTEPPSATLSSSAAVRVRVYNDTGLTLRDVKVGLSSGVVISETTMAPGSYSEYLTPQLAYRLAGLEATADGRVYRSTPDDLLGEQPLDPGSYTFSIRLVEGVMFLEFGQD
jgi:Heat shock protein